MTWPTRTERQITKPIKAKPVGPQTAGKSSSKPSPQMYAKALQKRP